MNASDSTSREIRLKSRPTGLPTTDHFELVTTSVPERGPGEVLVKNRYFLVSASLRAMISEGAEDVPGVPFPALKPGETLRGEALGEVVEAPADCPLRSGDIVTHFNGWRDYACVAPEACHRVGDPLPEPVGYLGYLGHGWTAYAALTHGVQVHAGDTVFVSSAAGAIGSMAGQIARKLGARRVVGSTSTREKAQRIVTELGYDAAVIRESDVPLADQLYDATQGGIDVFIDAVGGPQLQAALAVAREGARFLILGALSGQLAATGTGRTAPVEIDGVQFLLKRITMRGYSADDNPEAHAAWLALFPAWLRAGDIRFPHTVIDGLEHAAAALEDTARGRHIGTVIVRL
jgi:2-alkenal reductase